MLILVLFTKFICHIFMELFQVLSQFQNPSAQSFDDAHRDRVVHRGINAVHVVHRDYFFPNSFSVICLARVIQILTVKISALKSIYETRVAEDNTRAHLDFCFMSSVHKTTFIFH